jgi:hypothetical protein
MYNNKQASALRINATTAFPVKLLQQIPMDVKTAANKNRPRYAPVVEPMSIPASGADKAWMEMT